jgi:hypothetical protein
VLNNLALAADSDKILGPRELHSIKSAIEAYIKQKDTVLHYGNWYGSSWQATNANIKQAPVDSLDAIAQKHCFAYQIAEQQGKSYGITEEKRIKMLADYLAIRDAKALPENPKEWAKPPTDTNKASRYRDRMITGFAYEAPDYKNIARTANWTTSSIEQWKIDKTHHLNIDDLEKQVLRLQDDWLKQNTSPVSNPKQTPQ